MKKQLIGLDRYKIDFSSDKEKQDFINDNQDKYDIEEIYNGYWIIKLKVIKDKDIFNDSLEQNLEVTRNDLIIVKDRLEKLKMFDELQRLENCIRLIEKWF